MGLNTMKDLTPKEKAEELVSKYITNQNSWYLENLVDGLRIAHAKQCALIAVDEILKVSLSYAGRDYDYYQEVKQEIEKL
jgi:hypothetical protein